MKTKNAQCRLGECRMAYVDGQTYASGVFGQFADYVEALDDWLDNALKAPSGEAEQRFIDGFKEKLGSGQEE